MPEPRLIKGTELNHNQRREVLARFTNRLTIDNQRNTHMPMDLLQLTDEQWIEGHAFYINHNGHLARRPNHCEQARLVDEIEQAEQREASYHVNPR